MHLNIANVSRNTINATKMSAEYGIKWHLLISKGTFYWMYCDIENSEIKAEQKKYLKDKDYDSNIEETLSDLLHTITTTYSPKAVVKDARVPGFKFDVIVVEQVKTKTPWQDTNPNESLFKIPLTHFFNLAFLL